MDMRVSDLSPEKQKEVKRALQKALAKEDLNMYDRFQAMEDGMNSKVIDLEDTIDLVALGLKEKKNE